MIVIDFLIVYANIVNVPINFRMIRGYRLVVGHVLAKDEIGVRFSLPAQFKWYT